MKQLPKPIIFIMLLLIGLVLIGCGRSDRPELGSNSTATDNFTIEMTATDSISPLQLLLNHHEVEYRSSMMGAFVTAVDSVENSSDGYWVFKVNDTTPKVACDRMTLQAGDRLKWLFQSASPSKSADSSSSD